MTGCRLHCALAKILWEHTCGWLLMLAALASTWLKGIFLLERRGVDFILSRLL